MRKRKIMDILGIFMLAYFVFGDFTLTFTNKETCKVREFKFTGLLWCGLDAYSRFKYPLPKELDTEPVKMFKYSTK